MYHTSSMNINAIQTNSNTKDLFFLKKEISLLEQAGSG